MSTPHGPHGPYNPGTGPQAPLGRDGPPLPGQQAVITAAMVMGFVLLGAQLWLLTVALDLYLAGRGRNIWLLALVSGLIVAGGLGMLYLMHRRPRVQRLTTDESGRTVKRFENMR